MHFLAHLSTLLAVVLWHFSLVRHWHTHIIDFHLDNLTFTENSQPLHHRTPSPSLDVRARLTVICHHISSLSLSFSLCFFFPDSFFLNLTNSWTLHQSNRLHASAHTQALQIHFPPAVFLFSPPTSHYLRVVGQSNRNKNCTTNIIC